MWGMMVNRKTYCVYCGRLTHRCGCAEPDSDLNRFLSRGDKTYQALTRTNPPKWAVPPQVKQRERRKLRKHLRAWHVHLLARDGASCVNCGAAGDLVLDHILPIARGGMSRLDNLQLLCSTCNRIKGKLMIICCSARYRE